MTTSVPAQTVGAVASVVKGITRWELRPVDWPPCLDCETRATHVIVTRNLRYGVRRRGLYCEPCGRELLRELEAARPT